jgi:RNA polymerase sigma-70 factor (ECF subfamily)
LAGKYGFAADEADDLRQELSLHLLKQWPAYDETKGKPTTFIANVIDAKVCDMLRTQQSRIPEVELTDSLMDEAERGTLDGIRGQPAVNDFEQVDLRLDCDAVLAGLPSELRQIAELLKEISVAAAARELGIPKTTLWRRVDVLRTHFEAAGFPFTETQFEEHE